MIGSSLRGEKIGGRKGPQIAACAVRAFAEAPSHMRVREGKVVAQRPAVLRIRSSASDHLAHRTATLFGGGRLERGGEKRPSRRRTAEFHRPEVVDEHGSPEASALLDPVAGDAEQAGAGKMETQQAAGVTARRHECLPEIGGHFGGERADQDIGILRLVGADLYH